MHLAWHILYKSPSFIVNGCYDNIHPFRMLCIVFSSIPCIHAWWFLYGWDLQFYMWYIINILLWLWLTFKQIVDDLCIVLIFIYSLCTITIFMASWNLFCVFDTRFVDGPSDMANHIHTVSCTFNTCIQHKCKHYQRVTYEGYSISSSSHHKIMCTQ